MPPETVLNCMRAKRSPLPSRARALKARRRDKIAGNSNSSKKRLDRRGRKTRARVGSKVDASARPLLLLLLSNQINQPRPSPTPRPASLLSLRVLPCPMIWPALGHHQEQRVWSLKDKHLSAAAHLVVPGLLSFGRSEATEMPALPWPAKCSSWRPDPHLPSAERRRNTTTEAILRAKTKNLPTQCDPESCVG